MARVFREVGGSGMSDKHISVMREEVVEGLDVQRGAKYIDATVGSGGHAVEIAKLGAIVLGIDTDPTAVTLARLELTKTGVKDWKIVQGNFRDIEAIAKREGFERVRGILFDLGVSSMQLDTPDRGFSYRFTDAPLDLRMNQSEGEPAAQLVNRISEDELYDIFSTYGEEELARVIAHALYRARSVKKIETVGDVVEVIENITKDRNERYATLSRIFQALRIAVNDELQSLRQGLAGAKHLLIPGGRLVVISFHSLEDRTVKRFMREGEWEVITKHPMLPTIDETGTNRRARSAKTRIAIRK